MSRAEMRSRFDQGQFNIYWAVIMLMKKPNARALVNAHIPGSVTMHFYDRSVTRKVVWWYKYCVIIFNNFPDIASSVETVLCPLFLHPLGQACEFQGATMRRHVLQMIWKDIDQGADNIKYTWNIFVTPGYNIFERHIWRLDIWQVDDGLRRAEMAELLSGL
ncbi:hypothetical protein VM1G_03340 [Cytospora mali]|uniref:Uncharacterized protein n=1 Tax=Cytospora mali TaxID=578113 RepID=A0A194VT66_CYTMA|nr:hypothetical protein VM1G_03340 [Valsa mali]